MLGDSHKLHAVSAHHDQCVSGLLMFEVLLVVSQQSLFLLGEQLRATPANSQSK